LTKGEKAAIGLQLAAAAGGRSSQMDLCHRCGASGKHIEKVGGIGIDWGPLRMQLVDYVVGAWNKVYDIRTHTSSLRS
jgi:hypothetical protein